MKPDNIFGKYRIVGLLGRGGQGETYEAVVLDGRHAGRHVALKVMAKEFQGHGVDAAKGRVAIISRLRAEGRVTKHLESPNIAQLLDFGGVGDVWYLAFELVKGASLHEIMAVKDDQGLDPDLVTYTALEISKALACAHDQGVIHRDLKPSNVMVGEIAGKAGQVKLIDFGMAKSGAIGLSASAYTQGVGTERYWAPEQVVWDATLGPQTDIFALGICMFEMLTRRHPFYDPEHPEAFLRNLVEGRFVHRLDDRNVPADLVAITKACLEKEIPRRFASGGALRNALLETLEGTAPQNELAATRMGALATRGGELRQRAFDMMDSESDPIEGDHSTSIPEGYQHEDLADDIIEPPKKAPPDAPTVVDGVHRRVTRAVDTATMASQAADAIPSDESQIRRELTQLARNAEQRATDTTNPGGRKKPAATPDFPQPVARAPEDLDAAITVVHPGRLPPAAPSRKLHPAALAGLSLLVGIIATTLLTARSTGAPTSVQSEAMPALAAPAATTAEAKPAKPANPSSPAINPDSGTPPLPEHPMPRALPLPTTRPKDPKPTRASVRRHRLKVGAIPQADIFVNGKRVGLSPVVTQVAPGRVRIVAKIDRLRVVKRITMPDHDHDFLIDMRDPE